jgi:hypothetical protein
MSMLRALALAAVPLALAATEGPLSTARSPLRTPLPLTPRHVRYAIEATLAEGRWEIAGQVRIALRNHTRRPLREALLHLYLNAFAGPDTLFMRSSHGTMRVSRADPDQPGWIRVSAVRAGGLAAPHRLLDDGTVMRVTLPRPVAPGGELLLELRFVSHLPWIFARTGHAGDLVAAAQWYPKPGVLLDDGSWHCPAYHAQSEYFADFGSYDVVLDLPASYVVGATGVQVARQLRADRQLLRHRADDVHDFAFFASPTLVEERRQVGGIAVRYLAPRGRAHASRQLGLVEHALPRLERWLGTYPYTELTVVDVPTIALGAAAMEYPTLFTTWIPRWAPHGVHLFDEITIHELVHQYFQGIVASNEVSEPWLDEGVTSYVAGVLLDELLGEDRSYLELGPLRLGNRGKEQLRIAGSTPVLPVALAAARYPSWQRYAQTVYARAALLLVTVESLVGRNAMRAALADYVRSFRFRHPTSRDLEDALLARAPAELRADIAALLVAVLHQGSEVAYSIRCDGDRIEVRRRGGVHLPLEITVNATGASTRLSWDGRARSFATRVAGLRSARLGPPGRLALDGAPLDDACVVERGSTRATLGLATALQRVLQLVGP